MPNLISNERAKLTATFVNGAGLACVAAGFITPYVAASFGIRNGGHHGYFVNFVAGLAWLGAGLALHWIARRFLGGLRE